ncbi:farnesol dehydrogenase-like [Thrips palmi]|uniref:Farnesol dehydrogenase-like n=1 Tax=Thrips palmi TaxID=161013 RepID=A0A6P8ZA47_THRPL|nr:farnesol dehydrogenase-like [Thrips palmi]
MDHLAGRVAVVTGASSGIGEELALLLARAGLVVVAVARRKQRLKDLAARAAKVKGKLHPFVADMAEAGDVAKLFKWVDTALGGITILVNNAAILPVDPLHDMEPARIQQLVNTNLTAVMLCCHEAMNSMRRHAIKDGHLVNINSILGHTVLNGAFSATAYAATKHAVTGLTRGLRFDALRIAGFNIRVSGVSPGGVLTDMISPHVPDSMKQVMLHPKDVAETVMYIISCPPGVEISELVIRHPAEAV